MKTIEIFKALANKNRQQIIFWLRNPEDYFVHESGVDMREVGVCVSEIQRFLGLTQSTTSHYLSMMSQADLLIVTRNGKWTYYRRNEETIAKLQDYIGQEL